IFEERYQRTAPDTIELVISVKDAEFYTAPWVGGKRTYRRLPLSEVQFSGWKSLYSGNTDAICAPMNEAEDYNKRIRDPAAPGGTARRIDVHHHMLPQRHMDAVAAARESGRPQPWSPQTSLEEMDKNDIATAIVSLVQPGVTLGTTEQARSLARDCNEYGAKMVQTHPGQRAFF